MEPESQELRNHWLTRFQNVRVRTTLGAVLVVGVALVVASIAMVIVLHRSLADNLESAALLRADSIAELVETGDSMELGDENDDDEFVQVLDERGQVIEGSANTGTTSLVDLVPGESREVSVPFDDDPFLAVAEAGPSGQTVVVGRSLETVLESSQVVLSLLFVGAPLLLLLVGAVTWGVVGRSLRPVESIRSEVEAISTEELHRRVPRPGGTDEIARLAETMNEMLRRLEEGQARQRRFVSDASHELRSPVASIRQHAEVALAHPEGSSAADLARVVRDEDLRLQRLVEDLLLLAHFDEHSNELEHQILDLDDIVFEEVNRIRDREERSIDSSRVSAGRVRGDRKQLARLVDNLLDNALRHARRTVAVSLGESDGRVLLSVDDDGAGVRAEERQRIFERFVRLQEARDRDSGGTGLGLAIVAKVTEAHGGEIRVEESASGGARFEVNLPGV
jgi:signal transduction histidine kinase